MHRRLRAATATLVAVSLFAAPVLADTNANAVAALVRDGDYAKAEKIAAEGLQQDPRDARLQFLNAFAHHLAGRSGDTRSFDLARVGYLTAAKFAPNDYWSHYMLGSLDFERGVWSEAQEHFAAAALSRPDDWRALAGLASASYYAGDQGLARLAAERAARLAPTEQDALRVAALTAAASGDAASAARYCAGYTAANGTDAAGLQARTALLVRTAAVDMQEPDAAGSDAAELPPDHQMLAEVTIILSDNVRDSARGLNLLDGLRLQYGYDNTGTSNTLTGAADSFQRTITQRISVPQLDYNLNIFNQAGESYNVLARPTLTAYLGEESSFFVGQTVNLEASGVNTATILPIDAGVTLKLTPQTITGQTVKFRVDVARSFFSNQHFGTFDKQLNTFKQQVAATAELNFGQTLILSGLSETVYDGARNDTPGLADIPLVNLLFSRHTVRDKQTSVLILVTPLPPAGLALNRRTDRAGMTKTIADLWTTLIDPSSDMTAVTQRLAHSPLFTRAQRGDLKVSGVEDPALRESALAGIAGL